MDVSSITQLISNVGFLIAACCVMFYQNSKLQDTLSNISATMQVLTNKITDLERKMEVNEYES